MFPSTRPSRQRLKRWAACSVGHGFVEPRAPNGLLLAAELRIEGWLPSGLMIVKWSPPDSSRARWLVMNDDGSDIAEIAAFEQANVTALAWHG